MRGLLIAVLVPAFFAGGLYVGPAVREAYRTTFPPPAYTTGDYREIYEAHGSTVVMYATASCPFCEKARLLLASMGVAYTELLIDESVAAKTEFVERGGRGVPLLYIGNRRIAGYQETVIREALEHIQPTEGVGLGLERSL